MELDNYSWSTAGCSILPAVSKEHIWQENSAYIYWQNAQTLFKLMVQ